MRRKTPFHVDFSAIRDRHVLIALSGGADSVALTRLLAEARVEYGLTLSAAHLDHGIRPESADDARWCGKLCGALDIPFHTKRIDVPAEAKRRGEGFETVARALRHEWLRALRDEIGADVIALAHHMDDQAETVLMHLSRGAGPEGIGGMPTLSGELYRPLLGVRKRELENWLRSIGQDWRTDFTNAVDDTPRNALRLHVIPELEKSYPQAVAAISRYAQSARLESAYIEEQTSVYSRRNSVGIPGGLWLRLTDELHPALLRRCIRRFCGSDTPWERVNAVAALAEKRHGVEEVSGSIIAERGRLGLYFLQNKPMSVFQTEYRPESVVELEGLCALTSSPAEPVPIRDNPLCQILDARALRGAVLRTRRNGDRIRPLGCGDKLLSDYLTDRHIDRPLRDRLALLAVENRVLWVCGVGVSEDAALRRDTREAVRIECRYSYRLMDILQEQITGKQKQEEQDHA